MYAFYNQFTKETLLLKDFEALRLQMTNQALDIYQNNDLNTKRKEQMTEVIKRLQTVENDAEMNLCLDMMFIYLQKERM